MANRWRKISFAAEPLTDVLKVRGSDIGPGFRNVDVAHTRFDHRT